MPAGEQIDLINVAFAKTAKVFVLEMIFFPQQFHLHLHFIPKDSFDAAPDRLTALRAFEELRAASPNRRWKMVLVDAEKEELARERQGRIAKLLYPHDTVLDDSIGWLMKS